MGTRLKRFVLTSHRKAKQPVIMSQNHGGGGWW